MIRSRTHRQTLLRRLRKLNAAAIAAQRSPIPKADVEAKPDRATARHRLEGWWWWKQ